jgi:hypothetical protein
MPHHHLRVALEAFAREAAARLAADTAQGAEVPFEIVEGGRRRRRDTPLYCYRPLTDRFIAQRSGLLGGLESHDPARRALAALDGVGDYLRAQGEPRVPVEPRERADAALVVFLSRAFADATEFALTPERFERAWRELESTLSASRAETAVVVALLGVELESSEVALGEGLALVADDAFEDAPPEALRPGGGPPGVLAVFSAVDVPGGTSTITAARKRFRRLISALRLFDDAAPALGPVAWSRSGAGPWRLVPLLGAGARSRGTLVLPPAVEDELRAFCSLVARRTPRSGEIAWALGRFELGCERPTPFEALTDHLLALRALLEPEGPASGRLPGRLAALCAPDDERAGLAERVAQAIALERAVVAGIAPAQPATEALVLELGAHLRALLRDVFCGHLDADLRGLADELLAEHSVV